MASLALGAVALACGGADRAPQTVDSVAAPVQVVDTVAAAPTVVASPLDSATRAILAFLRRERAFSTIELADTVELYVGTEAGGTRTAIAREQLQRPSFWIAQSKLGNYKLAPPPTHVVTTVKPGVHFICTERALKESFPQLARRPHVGVLLEPEFRDSCLQTWNVTFVFSDSIRPRLVAAIYDQFEW